MLSLGKFLALTENDTMKIYWNDENYVFDPKKRYLLYFLGNFSPVHKAHFARVRRFAHVPNAKYFISHLGDERRHGIPYDLSRKMWKTYIKLLTPEEQGRVTVQKMRHGTKDIKKHLKGVDIVLYIRGNDDKKLNERTTKNERAFRKYEAKFLHDREPLIRILKKRGIKLDFIIASRKDHISATAFTMAVKNRRPYKEIRQFLPEELPEATGRRIVKEMAKCKLIERGAK